MKIDPRIKQIVSQIRQRMAEIRREQADRERTIERAMKSASATAAMSPSFRPEVVTALEEILRSLQPGGLQN